MDAAFLNLIEEIERKRSEISCARSGAFFRGHSKSSYELVPSLLREEVNYDTEHNLYHECFARAGHVVARDASSWERLAYFQHHGIPTRLLDWTDSLAVAIFFAISGSNKDGPELWILNAFLMNRDPGAIGRPYITVAGLDPLADYHDCFVRLHEPATWPHSKPIFLQIPWTTDRIRAQSGFFTFHPDSTPLNRTYKRYTRRVSIPEESIPGAERFLIHAGINEHTIFPDFVGLAAYLRDRYRI
jgi:hypothetical protein